MSDKITFALLNNNNYHEWKDNAAGFLRSKGLFRLVTGQKLRPTSPGDKQDEWDDDQEVAAGHLANMVDRSLHHHFKSYEADPVRMWDIFKRLNTAVAPGMRFNAYDDLFGMRKKDDETLEDFGDRVTNAMQRVKDIRPTAFTLLDLDQELEVMVMLRGLDENFRDWTENLMLQDLNVSTVTEAFKMRTTNSKQRASAEASGSGPSQAAMAVTVPSPPPPPPVVKKCDFCGKTGHLQPQCYVYINARKNCRAGNSKPKEQQASHVSEFVGTAAVRHLLPSPSSNHPPLTAQLVADTGASSTMIPHRSWFLTYEPCRIPIRMPHNKVIYAVGIGSVGFIPRIGGNEQPMIEFTQVLHVPDLRNSLLSVLYLTKHRGLSVFIEGGVVKFTLNGTLLFTATAADDQNIAYLDGTVVGPESANFSSSIHTLPLNRQLWHRRLCHHSLDSVSAMHNHNLVTGMKLVYSGKPDPICEPCLAGKMNANPFPPSDDTVTRILQRVYSDVHQLHTQTRDGYKYWITFIDALTKFYVVYLLKRKSDAFTAFKDYKAYAENITGQRMGEFQMDKGGEYISKAFLAYLREHGIVVRMTVRNRPQQNGVAERANRTIEEHTTSMLEQAGLPDSFRGEAVGAYVHVRNMIPTAANPTTTPFELWHKKKPEVSNLRIWGCNAYVHVQKDKRTGIHSHMERCIFLGYPPDYAGWKFYNPVTRKTVISERAEFDERYFPALKQKVSLPILPVVGSPLLDPVLDSDLEEVVDLGGGLEPKRRSKPTQPQIEEVPDEDDLNSGSSDDDHEPPPSPPPPSPPPSNHSPSPPPQPPPRKRQKTKHVTPTLASNRPKRNVRKPGAWWILPPPTEQREHIPVAQEGEREDDHEAEVEEQENGMLVVEFAGVAFQDEPQSLKEAMKRSDAAEWYEAASTEMNNHERHGTWTLVKAPKGVNLVDGRWVLVRKRNADGSIERYKARWVAKGFKQVKGIDYEEVFAPTYRMATIRLVCALAAHYGLTLYSLDVTAAFLNGDLEEDVYMKQPEGFEVGGPEWVCKLQKAIYGLKQAARQWNLKLHSILIGMGYKRLESDRSMYVYQKGSTHIIIPIFIDDITIACKHQSDIDDLVAQLRKHFELRDIGPTSWLLGIAITQDLAKGTISLCQSLYIQDVLERFGMENCKARKTPMDYNHKLSKAESPRTPKDIEFMKDKPYLSLIGALRYLADGTRFDIAYAVGVLARFSANPGPMHWAAAQHVLRYLQGTKHYALVYRKGVEGEPFITYGDADLGGNLDTGKSTTGYIALMSGAAISWQSKLQSIVAKSTTEAEFVAASTTGNEIMWLRNVLKELGFEVKQTSVLFLDNQSAVQVAKNPEHHGRMKHLDLTYFWLRDVVEKGFIKPVYVSTVDNPADLLTKALQPVKFDGFRAMCGLGDVPG